MAPIVWQPDQLGDGFEMTYIYYPDGYSGKIRSTVIRKPTSGKSDKAILYVHGFSDYYRDGSILPWWSARPGALP